MRIFRFDPRDVLKYHHGIVEACAEVFSEQPRNEGDDNFTAFADGLKEYAGSPGFRAAVATDEAGEIQGVRLGCRLAPRQLVAQPRR